MLENFLVIMGLIAIFVLMNEFFDAIAAVVCVALGIAAVIYATKNFDPTTLAWLTAFVALVCLAIWNKRREQRNKRKKTAEAISQANAAVAAQSKRSS
jgi:uncharacterized membrane protein YdjX (TVP38/TMEM64 family)